MEVLITWVGARDPFWFNSRTNREEPGPILSLLTNRQFGAVYLLLNLDSESDDFRRRATAVLRACQRLFPTVRVRQKPVDLVSVTDYREIYLVTNQVCQEVLQEEGRKDRDYYVYLSPGTPQMQTVWVLLVQSGLLPARMIQATPPDLMPPGEPSWKEVNLDLPEFPQVINPGETVRLVGILQAQNVNLSAENRRLHAELEAIRANIHGEQFPLLGPEFSLPGYLQSQERVLFTLALERAGGNAAKAARLLGIAAPAFRARAVTLGVRPRATQRSSSA
jgi:hypothetical protein